MVPIPTGIFDDPVGHAACVLLGGLWLALAWRARRPFWRAAGVVAGVVTLFTSPWLVRAGTGWFGNFPTIDKEGSLLFFLDGVHQRLYLQPLEAPSDAAVRLIGVHAGHLWATEALALLGSPMLAFNLQWLLQIGFAWLAAAWAIRVALADGGEPDAPLPSWMALVCAFPFGMGLHLFRDLNVTTVEKGGVGLLPLFVGCWLMAVRKGRAWLAALAVVYVGMALYNLYFAVVCAGFGALYVLVTLPGRWHHRQKLVGSVVVCGLVGLPVAAAQLWIQSGGPAIATPEQFLWQRAALDGFSLVPLRWKRLEVWRACNPVAAGLAIWGAWHLRKDPRAWRAGGIGMGLFVVSLGPTLLPGATPSEPLWKNPIYMGLHWLVPGFWRMAKPEVFFQPVWLMTLVAAAVGLRRLHDARPLLARTLAGAVLLVWWPLVRLHPAFPGMSAPLEAGDESQLAPEWQERVFRR